MNRRTFLRAALSLCFVTGLAWIWWDGRLSPERTVPSGDPANAPFAFEEVAREVGIEFTHAAPAALDARLAHIEPQIAGLGAAVSVADADGDGWMDLYATSSAFGAPNALYVNTGEGGFRERAAEAGLAQVNHAGEGCSTASVWADADNDGDEDCYLVKWGYAQLYANEGELRFRDATANGPLRRWLNALCATWIDYDRDGELDLFSAGYYADHVDLWNLRDARIMQDSFEFARNGGSNVLYRNTGALGFEDASARLGPQTNRWTMACAAADFDGDGWLDLYTANDYGPEELYWNRGGERFELAQNVGLAESSKSGMSVSLGDFRGDGRVGVYVTNISKRAHLFQGNNLRVNELDRTGRFQNVASDSASVEDCGWAWGAQFGDFDNDGYADLFVANGYVSADPEREYWYSMSKIAAGIGDVFLDAANWPPMDGRSLSGYERSRVLHNRRGRAWTDVAVDAGVTDLLDGRAVAVADLFNRGSLDVIVANQRGPLLVYRNRELGSGNWIAFQLVGSESNRQAIGAQLTLEYGGLRRTQVVDGGSGLSSQNDKRLHFGLGAATRVERALVRWPTGRVQELGELELGKLHRVLEAQP